MFSPGQSGLGGRLVIGEFEEVRRHTETLPYVTFNARQSAGDVSFGMSELAADAFQRPTDVLPQGEHGQIHPLPLVLAGIVIVYEFSEVIRSATWQDDFRSVLTGGRHLGISSYNGGPDSGRDRCRSTF